MTEPIRDYGQREGWFVRAKQGGWEWDAWCNTSHRLGAARTKASATKHAKAALAVLREARNVTS